MRAVSGQGAGYALKTGSGLPLQLQFSDVLTKWRRFFYQMAAEQGNTGLAAMDKKLKVAALQESVAKMGIVSRKEIKNWFTAETLGVSG